ncbi:MAG: hypothetical protein AB200_00430 [Parcubacteria bacterium C7867-005]|nr:MAG: hypothetical protein AB200_00430 [Parcubacteria bacterium C7867-005]
MAKVCDHTSVGMLVWKEGKLLLIERRKFPFGFAIPAGHVDEDTSFENAAIRELKEEVGLDAIDLELVIEGRKENLCRREDGSWHFWKIYKVDNKGELEPSSEETKRTGWYSSEEIQKLGERTEKYLAGEISDEEWEGDPGLEPVMYNWFKELNIIR